MASVIFIPDAFSCFILAVQLVPWERYQASGMKNMSVAGNFLLLSATFSLPGYALKLENNTSSRLRHML